MSHGCAVNDDEKSESKHGLCPSCGNRGLSVSVKTMLHHIKRPWEFSFMDSQYYFCEHSLCDAVYFNTDGDVVSEISIRTLFKQNHYPEDKLICYCFGITRDDLAHENRVKEFVIEQTRLSQCSCEVMNPSGRCCLKNF